MAELGFQRNIRPIKQWCKLQVRVVLILLEYIAQPRTDLAY